MKQGLFGWKGRIHVAFAIQSHGRIRQRCSSRCPLAAGERFCTSHEDVALSALGGSRVDAPHRKSWNELAGRMEPRFRGCSGSEACEKRLGAIAGSLTDLNASDAAVRLKWCEITMNPLINVLADKAASVTA